mmetsp:Transcript_103100/g.292065  ORF Transcript_103100/g.292065 Transcript_103100/m.292065 type:complete len:218 (-) Transcript_103100:22-675(-)
MPTRARGGGAGYRRRPRTGGERPARRREQREADGDPRRQPGGRGRRRHPRGAEGHAQRGEPHRGAGRGAAGGVWPAARPAGARGAGGSRRSQGEDTGCVRERAGREDPGLHLRSLGRAAEGGGAGRPALRDLPRTRGVLQLGAAGRRCVRGAAGGHAGPRGRPQAGQGRRDGSDLQRAGGRGRAGSPGGGPLPASRSAGACGRGGCRAARDRTAGAH